MSVVKGVYTIDFMLNNIVLIHLIKWEAWYLSVNIFRVKEENKSLLMDIVIFVNVYFLVLRLIIVLLST